MDTGAVRLMKELADVQKNTDLSLAVACQDSDIKTVRALIVGPPETPYEFGFFEFLMRFGKDYPQKSPTVNALTTNGGRCRFNPNIYATGKVCLSILGTWRGEAGEQWSSAQGLESILISIQSLMSSNPYENEPGFENSKTGEHAMNMKNYVRKIHHETIRISVIQRLEEYLGLRESQISKPEERRQLSDPSWEDDTQSEDDEPVFEPFKDLCKRRFLWYYDSYLKSIRAAKAESLENSDFKQMPFEGGSNSMKGKFNYTEIEQRLKGVYDALMKETHSWFEEGAAAVKDELTVATNLKAQFERAQKHYKSSDRFNVELSLVDNNNPFVWILTYFGQPMTNLDGGLITVKFHFSPRFPHEECRVFVQTELFHFRVSSSSGIVAFVSQSPPENALALVESVIAAMEEDKDVPYDPRMTVNPEASALFWGGEAGKKEYSRRLRRAAIRSMEG